MNKRAFRKHPGHIFMNAFCLLPKSFSWGYTFTPAGLPSLGLFPWYPLGSYPPGHILRAFLRNSVHKIKVKLGVVTHLGHPAFCSSSALSHFRPFKINKSTPKNKSTFWTWRCSYCHESYLKRCILCSKNNSRRGTPKMSSVIETLWE